ncbi:hypothetical protein [Jannaschia rubra]|uniref:Uncharacterized protein n=1 Tax=Jannaschia rubra TaxID=282197 RepID=A0A0M6XUV5_9RHOB|nr:hypothetical protein [Jannaschia rubra]CTQ34053.1 hypothetical protein JAN5088_02845 [Jannaschia rubra]SFG24221.1 hypothetical protein SAMN04488517_103293 [Jannaschia rubra]
MAHSASHRRPRGINFLLGGTVVTVGVLLYTMFGGPLDFSMGGAPSVRIDQAETVVGR